MPTDPPPGPIGYPGCDCCYPGCPGGPCVGNPATSDAYAPAWELEIRGLSIPCAYAYEGFHCLSMFGQSQWASAAPLGVWTLRGPTYPTDLAYHLISFDNAEYIADCATWTDAGPNVMTRISAGGCPDLPATVTLRPKGNTCADCCAIPKATSIFATCVSADCSWLIGVVIPLTPLSCLHAWSGSASVAVPPSGGKISMQVGCVVSAHQYAIGGAINGDDTPGFPNTGCFSAIGTNPFPYPASSCNPFLIDVTVLIGTGPGLRGCCLSPDPERNAIARFLITR